MTELSTEAFRRGDLHAQGHVTVLGRPMASTAMFVIGSCLVCVGPIGSFIAANVFASGIDRDFPPVLEAFPVDSTATVGLRLSLIKKRERDKQKADSPGKKEHSRAPQLLQGSRSSIIAASSLQAKHSVLSKHKVSTAHHLIDQPSLTSQQLHLSLPDLAMEDRDFLTHAVRAGLGLSPSPTQHLDEPLPETIRLNVHLLPTSEVGALRVANGIEC